MDLFHISVKPAVKKNIQILNIKIFKWILFILKSIHLFVAKIVLTENAARQSNEEMCAAMNQRY